jgi:hemerythrin-like domain-containing protein
MKALRILEDEHRTFAALLQALRHLVRETRAGAAPRHDVLAAIVYFMDTFSERMHHPKESDYLFRLLRARCPELAPTLDRLDDEHRAGYAAMRALEQALTRYREGGADEFDAFAAAAENNVDQQQKHMRREDQEVLTSARERLTPEDWRLLDDVFTGDAVPKFDRVATAGYDALFRRLVAMLPPPLGVGPP